MEWYALLAAVQLDLFTGLKDNAKTSELSVDSDKLEALLYPMVLIGLLAARDGSFSNTPAAARYLVMGMPDYMGDEYQAFTGRWTGVSKTAESILTGKAQHRVDVSSMSQAQLESFYRGSYSQTRAAGRELAAQYDFQTIVV